MRLNTRIFLHRFQEVSYEYGLHRLVLCALAMLLHTRSIFLHDFPMKTCVGTLLACHVSTTEDGYDVIHQKLARDLHTIGAWQARGRKPQLAWDTPVGVFPHVFFLNILYTYYTINRTYTYKATVKNSAQRMLLAIIQAIKNKIR